MSDAHWSREAATRSYHIPGHISSSAVHISYVVNHVHTSTQSCTHVQAVVIDDLVRGRVAWDSDSTVGDFILLRSSGVPVYNFCVAGQSPHMLSSHAEADVHILCLPLYSKMMSVAKQW